MTPGMDKWCYSMREYNNVIRSILSSIGPKTREMFEELKMNKTFNADKCKYLPDVVAHGKNGECTQSGMFVFEYDLKEPGDDSTATYVGKKMISGDTVHGFAKYYSEDKTRLYLVAHASDV